MTTLTLPPDVDRALADMAAATGKPLAELAADAIRRAVEDWRDTRDAAEAYARHDPADAIPHEVLMRRYGLET